VEKSAAALKMFATVESASLCDWQLDLSKGAELEMPHLMNARDLSRLVLLESRVCMADGKPELAVKSWINLLRLRDDTAHPPVLISELVGVALEKPLLSTMARYLPDLAEEQRQELFRAVASLAPLSASRGVDMERTMFGGWIRRTLEGVPDGQGGEGKAGRKDVMEFFRQLSADPAGLEPGKLPGISTDAFIKQMLDTLDDEYAKLSAIAALPFAEQAAAAKAWEASLQKTMEDAKTALKDFNPATAKEPPAAARYLLVGMVIPSLGGYMEKIRECALRRALFVAALDAVARGETALEGHSNPVDGRRFGYEKTAGGFVLSGSLPAPDGEGKEIRLVVGD
jgi:hypothetical protein